MSLLLQNDISIKGVGRSTQNYSFETGRSLKIETVEEPYSPFSAAEVDFDSLLGCLG